MTETFEITDDTPVSELLNIYQKVITQKKLYEGIEEQIKLKLKIFLKEKGWKKYKDDETDISFSITEMKRENVDKMQLKLILNASQYEQCVKTQIIERFNIITPELRKRLKKFINKPSKVSLIK